MCRVEFPNRWVKSRKEPGTPTSIFLQGCCFIVFIWLGFLQTLIVWCPLMLQPTGSLVAAYHRKWQSPRFSNLTNVWVTNEYGLTYSCLPALLALSAFLGSKSSLSASETSGDSSVTSLICLLTLRLRSAICSYYFCSRLQKSSRRKRNLARLCL